MKILGLDSSGLVAGVAVVEKDNLLAEYTVNYKKTHSQTLLPIYRASNRFRHCQGSGPCSAETPDSDSNRRRSCL